MEYMTVVDAAAGWGVSPRLVHRYLQDGRVAGAVRFGPAWMIPADAAKPGDPRRERKTDSLPSDLAHVLSASRISMSRDIPFKTVNAASEERLRRMREGTIAYLRGDFALAIQCYQHNEGDSAAKLAASPIAIAAAISAGDYSFYTEVETFLAGIVQTNTRPDVNAFAELSLATAYLGAGVPKMVPGWLKDGDFTALPAQAKPRAAYLRVLYLQWLGKFESMLDVAQTALAFFDPQAHPIIGAYLRLMCAFACYALGRADEAKRRLLESMNICLPHGFITPFADKISLFGGMVEQCLEREFPAQYSAVMEQWQRTFTNWLSFHNRFTKDNITLILSLREYQMALLAARGMPNAAIAERFHISVSRLKTIMHQIYGKLFVKNRKELSQYIL